MNTTETKVEILPCPWCDERPELEDGDVVVSHSDDCFFSRHYSQEMWLIGRKLERWNHRTPDQSAITAAREALSGLFAIVKESKRMRVEFPAGTCNAEDAWKEFSDREEMAWKKARQALERLG
jgi:sarcosine oxidase delta subunit